VKALELPTLPPKFRYRLDLRHHVTPKLMRDEPVYRWFIFPHSFSPQVVDEILKEYPLTNRVALLDPFVGAGTTVLWAKQHGFPATGIDLSPLSVFVSRAKLTSYKLDELANALRYVLDYQPISIVWDQYPERIRKAFIHAELTHIEGLKNRIQALESFVSPFFILALLKVQQKLSRAVPDGGWFRWIEKEDQSCDISRLFEQQVKMQVDDLIGQTFVRQSEWPIHLMDARTVDTLTDEYSALITSPPYPNRHDYSRIFHMELLALGASEDDVFQFRHASIRSHVEAHKPDIKAEGYLMPDKLRQTLDALPENIDRRIAPMIAGYFEDMYLCMRSAYKRLKPGSPCAFVVGNVRHAGVMVMVDEILAEVGEQAGLVLDCAWVARLRGNSAQQMDVYGREPSRETIVILRRQ